MWYGGKDVSTRKRAGRLGFTMDNSLILLRKLVPCALLVVGLGCPATPIVDETGTTGDDPTDGPVTMSTAGPTTTPPGMTSTPPDTDTTGGVPTLACVDENIGTSIGAGVASGTNAGAGDDFGLEYCFGGGSTDTAGTFGTTGWSTTGGTWGTDGGTFGTSGGTFGTTSAGTSPTSGGTFPTSGGTFSTSDSTYGTWGTWGTYGTTFGSGGSSGDDYVVQWTAPQAGTYVFSTDGSGFDTVLGVFPPQCGAAEHACNDDCFDLQSAVSYTAGEGEVVLVVIEGYGGGTGEFTLSITQDRALECFSGGSTG
jgi:hypothetical protein